MAHRRPVAHALRQVDRMILSCYPVAFSVQILARFPVAFSVQILARFPVAFSVQILARFAILAYQRRIVDRSRSRSRCSRQRSHSSL
jgi:hypothetical protein